MELKPCPFCGRGEAGTKWHHGYWSVQCGYQHDGTPSDHCFQDWGEFESEEQAVTAWNRRCAPKEPELPWPYSVFGAMHETAKSAFDNPDSP